jgi:RNA polymerase sigma factor (sigma-70 family)
MTYQEKELALLTVEKCIRKCSYNIVNATYHMFEFDDIYQELMLEVWERLEYCQKAYTTLVYQCSNNVYKRMKTKTKEKNMFVFIDDEEIEKMEEAKKNADTEFMLSLLISDESGEFETIKAVVLDNLTQTQIASKFGLSQSRICRKLKKELGEFEKLIKTIA